MMMIVICKHILFYKPKGLCQRAERSKPELLAQADSVSLVVIEKNKMKIYAKILSANKTKITG